MALGSISAEDLSTIGGIATVSLLHSFIPTHWLPFSIVGAPRNGPFPALSSSINLGKPWLMAWLKLIGWR
ncbi:hypothetical protein CFP56_025130 [Quercus suber]|uniref:Uncharacterized protein n=1 Tax=Quercus suber TaxID=58331 RepID=A0AAW0K4P6_QUESU